MVCNHSWPSRPNLRVSSAALELIKHPACRSVCTQHEFVVSAPRLRSCCAVLAFEHISTLRFVSECSCARYQCHDAACANLQAVGSHICLCDGTNYRTISCTERISKVCGTYRRPGRAQTGHPVTCDNRTSSRCDAERLQCGATSGRRMPGPREVCTVVSAAC